MRRSREVWLKNRAFKFPAKIYTCPVIIHNAELFTELWCIIEIFKGKFRYALQNDVT